VSAAYAAPRDPTAVLGRRVVAYAIDVAIPFVLFIALFAILSKTYENAGPGTCDEIKQFTDASFCSRSGDTAMALTGGAALVAFLVPLAVAFVNMVVLQSAQGASVGKLLLGLRVVDEGGHVAGFGPMLVRFFFLVIDSLCTVLGLVVAAATTPHRRVGDMVANTYVIGRVYEGQPVREAVATVAPMPAYMPYSQPVAPPSATPTPVWDPQRGAWVSFDPGTNVWLRYDDATRQWTRLD
jgi:uncharacterized RDD family membrane protein YckC